MENKVIKNLVSVSKSVGACQEYVQGGGGNVSIKTDDQTMAIKSSGCKLFDIEENVGLVKVNYQKIKNYFLNIDIQTDEMESNKFILSCVKDGENSNSKPSIETGFHVFLEDFVLHTHSVYSNILSSCKEGKSLVKKIFLNYPINIKWIPYKNPGLGLTFAFMDVVENFDEIEKNEKTAVYVLQNHGIVVTGATSEDCYNCHQEINKQIINYFGLDYAYPKEYTIKKVEDNKFEINSDFLEANIEIINNIGQNIIFPDQIVFCDSSLVLVDNERGVVSIFTNNQEKAESIAEIIVSYVFVYKSMVNLGLEPNLLDSRDIEYVKNMESEKYRQQFLHKPKVI